LNSENYYSLSDHVRVVSVGFLEHVGYKNLSEFYEIVARSLKPGGIAVVQCITTGRTTTFPMDRWIPKYIFPNGYLPSPSLLALKSEMRLTVEDMQCLGMDYYRTLKAWYANYRKSRAGDSRGVVFDRMWEYYLLYSAAGFRGRKIHLFQVVYSKHLYDRYDAPR
jgi:cyclopropane-fatty-acyl-phospholipid synthase